MSTLFFIHLPKTGGTSLRHAAKREFPAERILMLYGKSSRWTSPAASAIAYDRGVKFEKRMARLSDHILANGIAFFASHLSATHLPCFDPGRAFTIVREPVERVLSEYFYYRRIGRTDLSLSAFIEAPRHRNVQARKLAKVELESLGTVGVLERYDAVIDRLNARFGLSFMPAHENRGSLLERIPYAVLCTVMRRRIEKLNEQDVALYRRARELSGG